MTNIDFHSLRAIGLTQHAIGQLAALPLSASDQLARVTQVHRDAVAIHDGQAEHLLRALPGLGTLVVGDWVLTEAHDNGQRWISKRLDPINQLGRRTADGRRQTLVSNIDSALLVMGLDHDFNLRRLERYLTLVQVADVAPVIVLTKADAAPDAQTKLEQLRQRLPRHLPVVAIDARSDSSRALLAPWLASGQTLVMLGSSGAGKSTLTNTLCASAQPTGGVREDDSRGRHTTTARSLHRCPDGACIVDTPGLRSWSPDASEEQLTASFDDIEALAAHCQFRDCQHGEEPGCAVRPGVDPDRLNNYRKLLREAARSHATPQDRIEARAKWKVVMKAMRQRVRDKQGR